jgi:hypothetical protein
MIAAVVKDQPPAAGFVLTDITAVEGDELALVRAAFEEHTSAEQEVRTRLELLDIAIPSAREIILSSLLVMAGIHAQEMGIGPDDFSRAAIAAREAAGEALAIGADIQGEA